MRTAVCFMTGLRSFRKEVRPPRYSRSTSLSSIPRPPRPSLGVRRPLLCRVAVTRSYLLGTQHSDLASLPTHLRLVASSTAGCDRPAPKDSRNAALLLRSRFWQSASSSPCRRCRRSVCARQIPLELPISPIALRIPDDRKHNRGVAVSDIRGRILSGSNCARLYA